MRCFNPTQVKKLILLCSLFTTHCLLITPTPAHAQTPYGGSSFTLPDRLEAEHFDLGGQNVAYYDSTAGNYYSVFRTSEDVDIGTTSDDNGTYTISWFQSPEWLKYSVNITQAGTYAIGIRTANQYSGTVMQLLLNDQPLGDAIPIPGTGDWSTYQTTTVQRDLPQGNHHLTLKVTQNSTGGYASNVNYLNFTLVTPSINPDGDFDFLDLQDVLSWFNQLAPFNYAGGSLIDIFDVNYILNRFLNPAPTPTNTPVPSNTPVPPPITGTPTPTQPATPTPTATPTAIPGTGLTVDFGTNEGPVTYRAAGFLGDDIDGSRPSQTTFTNYWLPLKLQLYSWILPNSSNNGATFPALDLAQQTNAYYQTKIWQQSSDADLSKGASSPWGQKVANAAQGIVANGYPKLQLDIFNEPDCCGYYPSNINDPFVLNAWRIAHDVARQYPTVKISGPNISGGPFSWLINTFIPTMANENRLPDIITWHEINTTKNQINQRINQVRNLLTLYGHPEIQMSINEYNYTNSFNQPGFGVQFMYELEKGKIQSASRACWEQVSGGTYDCAPHINGFLTNDGQPRSIWHTYKAYADMTGSLVAVNPVSNLVGVASHDNVSRKAFVLVGNITGSTLNPTAVTLTNLDKSSLYQAGQAINYQVYRIPNSNLNALSAPTLVASGALIPLNNQISVTLTDIAGYAAFNLVFSR